MPSKRKIFEGLTKAGLMGIAQHYEITGLTGQNKTQIIDILARSRSVKSEECLALLTRDDLKALCDKVGLDDSGREKQALIDRLLGSNNNQSTATEPTTRTSMAKRKPKNDDGLNIDDYRHKGAKRKNNPPAKIAAEGVVPVLPKIEYSYSPRRSPTLQFDSSGKADRLPNLLAEATERPLTKTEVQELAEALRTYQPWLEWSGKREEEAKGIVVDPVALLMHERVSAQAILRIAGRQDVERTLFGDPEQEYHEAVQFYKHDIDWTNRIVLGDSLQVMASLARREDLAGKVQMIYMDPPYGIKYASNFQPEVGKRDVKDKDSDFTRELEMVKAYRDTWHLGVHSYLSYLRDRLIVARELLTDSGSVFVQIGDENLHHVRELMDDVFGPTNFRAVIAVKKTAGLGTQGLVEVTDYLLWYARNREQLKERSVYVRQDFSSDPNYVWVLSGVGEKRRLASDEQTSGHLPADTRLFRHQIFLAAGRTPSCVYPLSFDGEEFLPTAGRSWSTNQTGAERLARASRLSINGNSVNYLRFSTDWGRTPLSNMWEDGASGVGMNKVYVVQTNVKIVQRCMLMATDPSDLVLDPTCGSATTAYVAEQWGRRWITIDTSRVAIAIARQRLLTAKYDFFRLRDETVGVAGNFQYKTVPHITLKSIAQNPNLDPIFAKHEPILETKLAPCNTALGKVTPDIRRRLELKLIDKQRAEGKRAIIDADRRRWELPEKDQKWDQWQVPFDTDPDWPKELADAVTAYRNAWRSKMDEVNACIAANAEQEELVDEPEIVKGVVRVSGPFTVEAVQPPELSLGQLAEIESPISGAPESLDTFEVRNAEAYLDHMLKLLQMDGVRFPDNKEQTFSRLERVTGNDGAIHAEGRWVLKGEEDPDADGKATVAVAFGPQYGPVTAKHVENVIRATNRRGYDDLVIAGFSFDGPAQAIITESQHPKLRVHIAHIRPDVNPGMDGLLKEKPGSQLFTVFGQPRTTLKGPDKRGEYTVIMEGVDIYDPVTNTIRSTEDQKVAAWFLDGDYDGRTFCITQAFFPDRSAWEKLSKALNGLVDAERFEAFSGTVSLPFPPGKHRCVAVKVIDPRGNEVMQVHRLD